MTPPELPELTPATMEDDQELGEAIDRAVLVATGADSSLATTSGDIADLEIVLQEVLGPTHWPIYLRIEELKTARAADLLVALVRWAFTSGVRCGSPPSGGS